MIKKILVATLAAFGFATSSGLCVVPQKATLAELVDQAEVVAVVKDVRIVPTVKGDGDYYFRVSASTVKVLKGDLSENEFLIVRLDKTVSERSQSCCESGSSYLMFLSRNGKGELTPIRVVNSVIDLGKLT